jgi:hypothetical protein
MWYHSNIKEFAEVLGDYGLKYPDLQLVIKLLEQYEWWFERTYSEYKKNLLRAYPLIRENVK